jgi:pyruvate dehydrogenase E1 component alpha subunit
MLTPFQILAADGSVTQPDLLPPLDQVESIYRKMVRLRHFDDRLMVLYKQSKMGTYPQFGGQEASQLGATLALSQGDYLAPMYRNTGAALAFGWSPKQAILYWRGHPAGWKIPDELNMLPIIIDIASQFPHAAGAATALKLRGLPQVVLSFIGEGGTSQGDFHVGVNWASAMRAPAVFVIENNGYAISVPRALQSGADYLFKRAEGYGIPGHLVDGNDVFAVHHIAKEAVERARRGEGPSLIEHLTYRLRPHTTGDDPKAYRSDAETQEWAEHRDPLLRVRLLLTAQGHWDDQHEAELRKEAEEEFNAALAEADATPAPDPHALLEYAMASPTPALRAQGKILEQRIRLLEAQA